MTQSKKLKQRVRARMQKTGESYSVARAHVVARVDAKRTARTKAAADRAASSDAKGAVSEARLIEKTGHGFKRWFEVLDRFRARAKGHKAAAKHLVAEHDVSAWYAQAITVAWERARDIRVVGQTCEGSFQVSVTKALPVSADAAADALEDARFVAEWTADMDAGWAAAAREGFGGPFNRAGTAPTLRFAGPEGAVDVRITPKTDERSSIAVQIRKLDSRERLEAVRAVWKPVLAALRQRLASPDA